MEVNNVGSEAYRLLNGYRAAAWRRTAIESVQEVGRNALDECLEQIRFTKKLVETLRENKLLGEKLYWIIFVTYMTNRQHEDVEDILSEIAIKYKNIPRRTYFRLRNQAIKILDNRIKDLSIM